MSDKLNSPAFSVVISVYNKEPHIARSINSVLNQTWSDFELIVVCDPSTDGSNREVLKFNDPRIRVLYRGEPGPGGYAARNLGIKEGKAEWIAFLDADDEWCPEHLMKMRALIADFPEASVMGCGSEIVSPEASFERQCDTYFNKRKERGNHFLSFNEYLKSEVKGMRPLNGITACIKKNILLGVGAFPAGKANRGGDVDTWLRCIERAGGIAWSSHIGAIYYRDSVNMVTRTQRFLAEAERDTVRLLLTRHNNETAELLKKFSNRRTINAWRQNRINKGQGSFNLAAKLYLSVDTLRNILLILFSLMPAALFTQLLEWKKQLQVSLVPWLKKTQLAEFARFGRAWSYRFLAKPTFKGKLQERETISLSDGKNPTFFGYHDKTPFSADGSKILAMSTSASDTEPKSECTRMKLGYFSKQGDGFSPRFKVFSETATWCWQQGCMLQWHPQNADRWVVFNDLVDGRYGSRIFDVAAEKEVCSHIYPVYSLDPTGKWATTLNFSRLGRLRPGYGYASLPDLTKGELAPEHDGLFIFSLETGERKLLVDLRHLAEDSGEKEAEHYVNHATFSPDAKRIVFFHLWAREGNHGRGLRVCEVNVASGKLREVERKRTISHYCWRDDDVFLATTKEKDGRWHYSLYDLKAGKRTDLDLPFDEDGHPMFHPVDKSLIVTDTYPDQRRDQHLCVVDITKKSSQEVASLFSPFRYRGQIRCDLHPRWDHNGRFLAVDSAASGYRNLVVVRL